MVQRLTWAFASLAASFCSQRVAGAYNGSAVATSFFERLGGAPPAKFVCPWLCFGCCEHEETWVLATWKDHKRFTCIVRPESAHNVQDNLGPRKCSDPVQNHDHMETVCQLTAEEQKNRAADVLPECFEEPLVRSYSAFLDGSCSVTPVGYALGGGVVGWAIEQMYFQASGVAMDGVCDHKSDEFKENGKFEHICQRSCISPSAPVCNRCHELAKQDLCTTLKGDLRSGRLDEFAMAVWAGAVGSLQVLKQIPKPSSEPRLLKKIHIPGWPAKTVAIEAPPEDNEIDLAGGGFMCMMLKLQALPLQDELEEERNNYITDLLHIGLGKQSALAPRSAEDTLLEYFNRYLLYPQPFHFDVPANELLTDRTLERLVFEAVGAHRLELLESGLPTESFNPMVPLLPSAGFVQGLPSDVKDDARFVVRMEGLFEDLPLRKDMARWGGNAFFSSKGKLIAIQYNGQTMTPNYWEVAEDDEDEARVHRQWEYFKFIFRSSLVSTVTAFDHLVATHILVSETMALAVHEMLPPSHALRLLLFPHTYKGLAINFKAANNLFPKNMLVHRASPWADSAFVREGGDGLLWQKAEVLRYRTFPSLYKVYERYREAVPEMPQLPLFEDGMLLHGAITKHVGRSLLRRYGTGEMCDNKLRADRPVEKFVHRFFELADAGTPNFWPAELRGAHESCATLQALLAEYIFVCSGFHSHVGTVADFFRDTRFAATSWKAGELQPRPKQAMMMMLLASTTYADMPTFGSDFGKVFEKFRGVDNEPDFEALKTDVANIQANIMERNEERLDEGRLQFHLMEPKHVQLGVYV